MTAGWFQGRPLQFNDTISYQCVSVVPHNTTALQQPASEGSCSGKVVDCTDDDMVGRHTAHGPSWHLMIVASTPVLGMSSDASII
jgi:hypothetical protein